MGPTWTALSGESAPFPVTNMTRIFPPFPSTIMRRVPGLHSSFGFSFFDMTAKLPSPGLRALRCPMTKNSSWPQI